MAVGDPLEPAVRRNQVSATETATAEAERLNSAFGHNFSDPALITAALTHVSLKPSGQASAYQRLEFLGDRVLGVIVADMLYHRFPDEAEGAMAKRHAALVRREALAEVATRIDLGTFIRVASPDANQDLLDNPGVLADCCEAVIGALYLDGGLDAARAFVAAHWESMLEATPIPPRDPKTALQEWAQGRGKPLPDYQEIERSGPDHAPIFVVEVDVAGLPPQRGEGPSKRVATRIAAERMLALAEPEEDGTSGL